MPARIFGLLIAAAALAVTPASAALRVVATTADLTRCRDLQDQYSDQSLGVVDASVLALVERLGEAKLATLDHRHFALLRPGHVDALQLLP